MEYAQMPVDKQACGNPPASPNVLVDLVLAENMEDVIRKFVESMQVLDAGQRPLTKLGAVGLGMNRLAPPLHYEIVTELEHRDDLHYHRYDVYKINPPASCCWKG